MSEDQQNLMTWISEESDQEYEYAREHSHSKVVRLTAKDAEKLLKLNTHNRKVDEGTVLKYAYDMQEGRWRYNGIPLVISDDNRIIDGQHRLLALAMQDEGVSVTMLLVTGVKMSAQSTVDIGKGRDLAAILTLENIPNVDTQVAAGIRMYVIWDNDFLFVDTKHQRAHLSKPALKEWAVNNLDVVEALHEGMRYASMIPARNGVVLAVYAKVVEAQGKDVADAFFQSLADGIGLEHGSPILALRNRLLKIKIDRVRVSDREVIAYFINTFNNWRKGNKITRVQRAKGSWTKDNFPHLTTK